MSYTKTTWTNATGQPISASNLNKIEQGIYEAHLSQGTLFNVRKYGALGIGAPGATADQAGFAAAFAACIAAGGGIVYVPMGDYRVTGDFTQSMYVGFMGDGVDQTWITHSGNNTFLKAYGTLVDITTSRFAYGFSLFGNSGASAKGIRFGDNQFYKVHDFYCSGYTGTNGYGIDIVGTDQGGGVIGWTEDARLQDIHIRNCTRCLSVAPDTGTTSFRGLIIDNAILAAGPNQSAWYVGAGSVIYGGQFNVQFQADGNNSSGLNNNGTMQDNVFNLTSEIHGTFTNSKHYRLGANALFTGVGSVSPVWDTAQVAIDSTARWYVGAQATTTHPHIAGTISNFRGMGNNPAIYPFMTDHTTQNQGGFGLAWGANVSSPIVWMYGGDANSNAFEVRATAFAQKAADATAVFAVRSGGRVDAGLVYSNGKPLGGPTGTPTVALGSGGGVASGGTASIAAGSDSKSGRISITTGSSPAVNSILLTVTFPTAYADTPKTVVIASASATASQTNAWPFVDYSTISTTQFQLRIGTAAINASQAQEWLYQVL